MSLDTNKALTRRIYDQLLNDRLLEEIDELVVAAYDEHDPLPDQREGRDGLKDRVRMLVEGLVGTHLRRRRHCRRRRPSGRSLE